MTRLEYYLSKKIKILIFFFILLLTPFMYAFVLAVLLPNYEFSVNKVTRDNTASPGKQTLNEPQSKDQLNQIINLERERIFLSTRLKMVTSDSIYLVLNLRDSTLNLEMKGIPLRACKIYEYSTSKLFQHICQNPDFIPWFMLQFSVEEFEGTVPKIPILIKKAPKDTIEYKDMSAQLIPIEKNDVNFILYFSGNLFIEFEQKENNEFIGLMKKQYLYIKHRLYLAIDVLSSILRFTSPQPWVWIRLKLPKEDLRAVYRAMPSKAHLLIFPSG